MAALRVILALAILAVGGLFGRHVYLRAEAVERVHHIPSIRAVDAAVPVRVELNPVTDQVTVGLEVQWAAKPKDLLSKLGNAVTGTIVSDVWPPAIEAELSAFAYERNDWYARVVPYRAVVVQPHNR